MAVVSVKNWRDLKAQLVMTQSCQFLSLLPTQFLPVTPLSCLAHSQAADANMVKYRTGAWHPADHQPLHRVLSSHSQFRLVPPSHSLCGQGLRAVLRVGQPHQPISRAVGWKEVLLFSFLDASLSPEDSNFRDIILCFENVFIPTLYPVRNLSTALLSHHALATHVSNRALSFL